MVFLSITNSHKILLPESVANLLSPSMVFAFMLYTEKFCFRAKNGNAIQVTLTPMVSNQQADFAKTQDIIHALIAYPFC